MAGMKKADYLDMRRKIEQEHKEKLAALDKVYAMFGGNPISNNGTKGGGEVISHARAGWPHEISKRNAVREAIKVLVVPSFSLSDVRSVLNTNFPEYSVGIKDNQLSAILSKFAKDGELGTEKKKSGKTPAIYTHELAS
jgi:hypothetical protein